MQFRGDSSIGDLGCFALLEYLQVLLVSCFLEGSPRDAFADLLLPHSRLYVGANRLAFTDLKAIHLRLQGNKLDEWVAFSIVLKIADYSVVGVVAETEVARVICWDFAKVRQVSQLRHVKQLSVEIRCEKLQNQRFCVCVQHVHSLTEVVLQRSIRAVHVEFAVVEYRKSELKGLVYYLIDFALFDGNQVRVEESKVDALKLLFHSPSLFHVTKHFNGCALSDILDCLSVRSVVHYFEEIALALVLSRGRALIRVELDVLSEHRLHLQADGPVQFGDFHAAFYVKLKSLAKHDVVLLR